MTPKQQERIRAKIDAIKKALAADKKRWGGFYDDSRGLRYGPPELFLKLHDYSGALKYFQWFAKNFPDDMGYPIFLFEWTITLFMTGKVKEAEKMALRTYFGNTYLFDTFFGVPIVELDRYTPSNLSVAEHVATMEYSSDQADLQEFAGWLRGFIKSETFQRLANEFNDIGRQLQSEPVGPKRSALVKRLYSMLDDYA